MNGRARCLARAAELRTAISALDPGRWLGAGGRRAAVGVVCLVAMALLSASNVQAATITPTPRPTAVPASAGGQRTLSIFGQRFTPKKLRITRGTTVTWRNGDRVVHTITLEEARDAYGDPLAVAFDSGELAPRPKPVPGIARALGGEFSRTFTTAGTYHYYCRLHQGMAGTIVVAAATTPAEPAPTTATPSTPRTPTAGPRTPTATTATTVTPTTASRTPTVTATPASSRTSTCVAQLEAAVKFPRLPRGTQTISARALNAAGEGVFGASVEAVVQYATKTKTLALRHTDATGRTSTAWSVGSPTGTVRVDLTAVGGGCVARATATFQGAAG